MIAKQIVYLCLKEQWSPLSHRLDCNIKKDCVTTDPCDHILYNPNENVNE